MPPASDLDRRRGPVLFAGLVGLGVAAIAFAAVLGNPAPSATGGAPPDAYGGEGIQGTAVSWQRPVVDADGLAHQLGVRVVQVAVTGGGGLLDLRFQVLDPDLAASIHEPNVPPAIVDEATGLVARDLLMGHAHTEGFKSGVTYYYVFENPGNLVQRGGRVSVLLGNAEVEHVDVR